LRTKITNNDKPKYGIDVIDKKIADLNARNIYEPLAVKEHIVKEQQRLHL
jgi:chaperonin GroEL (HSP60 family)